MTTNEIDSEKKMAISLMEKRATHLLRGHYFNFEEYADTVTPALIDSPDEIFETCVALIPSTALRAYTVYLRNLLELVDFMPDPRGLMVGPYSDEQIEQKKRQLRPKYVRLYELVKDRLKDGTEAEYL